MSTSRSISETALLQANILKSKVFDIASTLPENELYQIRRRMIDTVQNIDDNIYNGFLLNNKIDRVRSFVNVVGRLMECKDYLEYAQKTSNADVEPLYRGIDELSNLLLVNSGTLN